MKPGFGWLPGFEKMPQIGRVRPPRSPRPAVTKLAGDGDSGLDRKTPLLLLPVRIETVFDPDVTELRVRVYPDQINIDSDDPRLTEHEIAAATSFWSQHPTATPAEREALWAEFSQQVGHLRAGHVARTVRSDRNVTARTSDPAATAHLLPDRWRVLCFRDDELLVEAVGKPIADHLETSPAPDVEPIELPSAGMKVTPGMAWMFDYDLAVEVGMAITVDLSSVPTPRSGFTTVMVLGVRKGDPHAEADRFAQLLEMHERSAGLGFVEPGTNTNNLADRPSPWRHRIRSTMNVLDDPGGWRKQGGTAAAELAHALGLPSIGALERAEGARGRHRERARDMNQVLAEPLLLHYVRHMLGNRNEVGLPTSGLVGLRNWFVDRVTGGDPLPTVRIGPQPYGVLPIGTWPVATDDPVASQVVHFVDELEPMWARSVERVPRIDPNATDTVTLADDDDVEAADLIPAVIAQHPHAARLFARTFYPLDEDFWSGLSTQSVYDFLRYTWIPEVSRELEDFADSVDAFATTVEAQIVLWELGVASIEAGLFDVQGESIAADRLEGVLAVAQSIVNLLNGWEYRQRPLQDFDLPRWNGALGHPAPPRLVDGRFGEEVEWHTEQLIGRDPAVPPGPDEPEAPTPSAYLNAVADRLSGTPTELDFAGRDPMLHQMLALAEATLAPGRVAGVVQALRRLAGVADQVDGHARLDRLVRETLGLVTNRLDAWMTSVHRGRLEALRGDAGGAPEGGLHLGNYGIVTDLVPSKVRASSGYVLAPSLAHAATASVLRSAWLSHGSSAPTSAAAVDLTSRRIRTAAWVLDGIRNGQRLGELLGYRFERHLHDAGASGAIHGVREQVVQLRRADLSGARRHGRADTTANEPVDGVELLEVRDRLDLGDSLTDLHDDVLEALDAIADVADAVADAALFDGTHQLIQGNSARAAAMFDAVSLGQGTPPELRSHLVRPDGISIDHRVAVLMPADARPAGRWPTGLRDRVSPQLAAWVEQMVPPAREVEFTVTSTATPSSIERFSAERLGISALDLVALSGGEPDALTPALAGLLTHRLGLPVDVELVTSPESGGSDRVGFDEFQTLARELISIMERAVPATTSTLTPPAGEAVEPPPVAIDSQVAAALLEEFVDATRSDDPERLAGLAVFGWPLGPEPDRRRPEFVKSARRITRAFEKEPDAQRLIAELFVQTPLVLPTAVIGSVVDPDGTSRSYRFPNDASFASDADAATWLAAMGRVREEVGRTTTASMLSTMLGVKGLDLVVGQDVIEPGDRWAALHRPVGEIGGRASLVAMVTDGHHPRAGDTVAGFIVDSWSERIPQAEQVGGVAFHHDAPSNRPPQSWLLAVPDGETPWTAAGVADMILDTIEWAKKRVVAPEDFDEWGHALPMSIVPGRLVRWPEDGDES